ISQSFATEIGEVYTVSFQLAGYLAAGETINDVRVSAAGVTEDFSFDKTGALTVNDIQWETKTFSFVATTATTTIEFSSLDAISGAGPVIDDVQVFEAGAGAVTDEPLVISGIAISDVDAGSNPLTVTLSLSGTGTLDFTTGTNTGALTGISGQGTGSLTFSGSQADVTAALASSIEYTSGSGFEGTETLQIDVSDAGSAGSGGAQVDSETIEITVVSYPSSALGVWLFDDTSDSSGNARDLTLNGASLPTLTGNGLIGGGIELDGSFGSSATVNSNNAVFDFGADDFTVQVWVNLDTFNTASGVGAGYGEQVLVEKLDGDGSPGDPGWTLTYFGNSIVFGGNYDSGTPFGFQAATDPNLALSQWQQFVVTRSDDTFKIYQNGQLIGTFISTETIGTSSNPLHIGARNGGDGRNFTVDGTIDNVVIYDGAWTANDVIEQWNGGAGNDIFPGNPTNAPVILAGGTLAYTENDPATAIDSAIYVFDADDTHIEGAKVEITGNFVQGEDVLDFADTANITGNYNPTTGILSLTGSDTLANYQAALRSITYENTSDDPDSSTRTISFTINDGDTNSIPATSTINVTPENDAPFAVADTVLTNQGIGGTLYIPASILLSNDTDADGDHLAVTGASGTGTTLNGDEVEYTIAGDLSLSSEVFTYDVEDPAGSADTATVSVERGASTNANEVIGSSADEFLIGTDLSDILTGNGGNDFFGGLGGDDTITGGAGKDGILGGKGADIMTGNGDADLFVWHDGDLDNGDVDTITDFNPSEDTLDLAGLLDTAFTPGDTANYVQAVTDGFDTIVSVDSDGLANGVNFVDVVVLTGVTTGNITFVYDDASTTTTVTITS
ncbi:MAG: DUF642 domain-containing protein, partial [Novosphingobium sp.]|nr:DUF642 domain-containing protein [Novosphingobium sp.]